MTQPQVIHPGTNKKTHIFNELIDSALCAIPSVVVTDSSLIPRYDCFSFNVDLRGKVTG